MRMRVFSAPTIIRTALGAWHTAVSNDKPKRPSLTPRPTAFAAALLMDGVR